RPHGRVKASGRGPDPLGGPRLRQPGVPDAHPGSRETAWSRPAGRPRAGAGRRAARLSARVVVLGSLNRDHVVRVPRLPVPGETVVGGELLTFAGGKGANQAVAAARLGAEVSMVGRVGDDESGRGLVDGLAEEGVDVSGVS